MFKLRFPLDMIEQWSAKYGYPPEDEILKVVVPQAKQCRYLGKSGFLKICHWKTPRTRKLCEKNSDRVIREATQIAFSAAAEELRIGVLTVLEGVAWPTASTILHFCHDAPLPDP